MLRRLSVRPQVLEGSVLYRCSELSPKRTLIDVTLLPSPTLSLSLFLIILYAPTVDISPQIIASRKFNIIRDSSDRAYACRCPGPPPQGLGCAAQLYFLVLWGSITCLLLVAMAHDCCIALSDPLQYAVVTSRGLCIRLVVGLWLTVLPVQVGQTHQVFIFPFCASCHLHHFFCDLPPLLALACADTFWNQGMLYTIILAFGVLPFSFIVVSYVKITRETLKIPLALGRHKAFSTCSSHLWVVTLCYGLATVVYLKQRSRDSIGTNKYLALLYTVVTPMFNPVIYSLRNKEARIALERLLWTK
ncbi:olfactory receptor 10AG1-like [Leptosomus discolor]